MPTPGWAVWCVSALLHFVSPIPLLNVLASTEAATRTPDVAYGTGPRHDLDIYAPRPAPATPAPVVVFFYGGGWETGDKETYRFVGAALARQGILAVVPNYRLHPAVVFPAFVQDAADAVSWTRRHAAEFGGDPNSLFLMGHSAGAYIAAILALDPDYLRAVGMRRQEVCGIIGLAGPYDFAASAPAGTRAVFGSEANWKAATPGNHVTNEAPPMLLAAGSADRTVDPGNTTRLAALLSQAGDQVATDIYPNVSHRAIVVALAPALAFLAPVRDATIGFIQSHKACGTMPR